MPTFIIVGLMVVPYIDANPLGNGYYTYKQRKFAIWTFLFGFIGLWVLMIVITGPSYEALAGCGSGQGKHGTRREWSLR